MFPQDEAGFSIDDQFYLGSSGLLVKPVTRPAATEETIYLPEDNVCNFTSTQGHASNPIFCLLHGFKIYYDYFTYRTYRGSPKGKNVTVPADLHQIPLLIRGGSIIPTRERPRRASSLMHRDPFTLRIALDSSLTARGEIYLDDGVTYAYKEGHLTWRGLALEKISKGAELRLSNIDLAATTPHAAVEGTALTEFRPENPFQTGMASVRVERVVVLGVPSKPKGVSVEGGRELEWEYVPGTSAAAGGKKGGEDGVASMLTIKDPALGVAADWAIRITM
jgi:mannosyl-oligosaccharide alpha-1,3-glucosidase